jgi:uncharacterized phiE125 gp8 family phage protein
MAAIVTPLADAEEPISLDLAKSHCRIDVDDEDSLLETVYIPSARQTVEQYTGLNILAAQVDALIPSNRGSPRWLPLPVQPGNKVIAMQAIDDENETTDIDLDAYGVEIMVEDCSMKSALIAQVPLPAARAYRIQYTTGYADGTCPPNLLLAMLEYLGDAYENRESQQSGTTIQDNPRAVRLCDPFRINFGV